MLEQISKVTLLYNPLYFNIFIDHLFMCSWICLRRQWIATDHKEDNLQSTTFIEWCDDADDWGEESVVETNGNITIQSQAIEICDSTSAEIEKSDADDNVVVEPIELPNTDVLQLLDSRKEIPLVSYLMSLAIYIEFNITKTLEV